MTRAAALLLLAVLAVTAADLRFRLRETAGLRRFGYPVRAVLPEGLTGIEWRLLESGKPVPAQFTRMPNGRIELDFNASIGPHDARDYTVQPGTGIAPQAGILVEQTGASFLVRHASGLEFDVPRNLIGFLKTVREKRGDYLRPGSEGLVITYRDDIEFRAGGEGPWGAPVKATIVKNGPLVAALRFETTEGLRGNRSVASVIDMEFPRSKSWVEARWTITDPEGFVTGLGADLNLNLRDSALVDFGATSMVYAALRKDQSAEFVAAYQTSGGTSWFVDLGGQRYAAGRGLAAEGWAHVMDRERATAVAIADFAQAVPGGRDRIGASSDGRLTLRRELPRGQTKELRFWLHFVSMPVQVGAATSPQSMQSPPKVEWQ